MTPRCRTVRRDPKGLYAKARAVRSCTSPGSTAHIRRPRTQTLRLYAGSLHGRAGAGDLLSHRLRPAWLLCCPTADQLAQSWVMRMSAKAGTRCPGVVQLATVPVAPWSKTDNLAAAQGIPPQFLVDILTNLRTDAWCRSHHRSRIDYNWRVRAPRSASPTLRCIDGPLAGVAISAATCPTGPHYRADRRLARAARQYAGAGETTLADVAGGALPEHVAQLAGDYRAQGEHAAASRHG